MTGITVGPSRKPRLCAFCDRTFTKIEHLQRHQRSHTGERPYKCNKCGKRYARSDVLARHIRNHLEDVHNTKKDYSGSSNETRLRSPNLDEQEQMRESAADVAAREDDDIIMSLCPTPPVQQQPTRQNRESSVTQIPNSPATTRYHGKDPGDPVVIEQPKSYLSLNTTVNGYPAAETVVTTILCSNMPTQVDQDHVMLQDSSNVRQLHSDTFENDSGIGRSPLHNTTSAVSQKLLQSDTQSLQSAETQPNDTVALSPYTGSASLGSSQIDNFGLDANFNAYHLGLDDFSGTSDLCMSPNTMSFLDFSSSLTCLPTPHHHGQFGQTQGLNNSMSMEQLKRIQQIWPRRRATPVVRIIRTLWRDVIQNEADNLFCEPNTGDARPFSGPSHQWTSRWHVDDECRTRLMKYCDAIQLPTNRQRFRKVQPDSPPPSSHMEKEFEGLSPGAARVKFPSVEMLDMSLDLFFRRFHPVMPFIHQATFDAKKAPASLLFPMCLIGLSILDPRGSENLIRPHLTRLIISCRIDITSKALGKCPPSQFLLALASSLLVLYLGLGFSKSLDDDQAHMLCVQTLHIAEKHGLFAAGDSEDLILELLGSPSDPEGLWKTWARVESAKRTILCLLLIDATYTRLLGTVGVVEVGKIEVILPCEAVLFETDTAARFLQVINAGAPITMLPMNLRHLSMAPPVILDGLGMQVLLAGVYLQLAPACHRLLAGNRLLRETYSFVPADLFAMDSEAKDISTLLASLPRNYSGKFLEGNTVNILLWNSLCMELTADPNLFELASGRGGPESVPKALANLATWSKSAGARRAVLHAAQIFHIMSQSRAPQNNMVMYESLLFISALVLGLYLFAVPNMEENLDSESCDFEIVKDINWSTVGGEGLFKISEPSNMIPCQNNSGQHSDSSCVIKKFIKDGGPISFAGEIYRGRGPTARKVLLNYAHLLDEIARWNGSEYSQLLRTISDFLIEYDQQG